MDTTKQSAVAGKVLKAFVHLIPVSKLRFLGWALL